MYKYKSYTPGIDILYPMLKILVFEKFYLTLLVH
jgi:hypothetical protein